MHGDFSRLTYTTAPLDTDGEFAAVLGLQGRLSLESDANENVAILAHFLRTLVTDLIGPAAGPGPDPGFGVSHADGSKPDLNIGAGHYYVGGLLVHTAGSSYLNQPGLQPTDKDLEDGLSAPALAYVRVWERLVTAIEDPRIREVALGASGPDTSARSKVVWQLLLAEAPRPEGGDQPQNRAQAMELWDRLEQTLTPAQRGRLRARTHGSEDTDDLCALAPGARYRGVENQLYRVEIHAAGEIGGDSATPPTFKWSRDNGSVVFPIETRTNNAVVVTTLGRDDRLALDVGDWVEIIDDHYTLNGTPDALCRVVDIHPDERLVTLDGPDGTVGTHPELHPFLRRWDQHPDKPASDSAITADVSTDGWMALEDGIEILLEPGSYRSGDFWTIPARVETGDIIWPADPADNTTPAARNPEGVTYFYAPLAYIAGPTDAPLDMRCKFPTLGCDTARLLQGAELDAVAEVAPATATAPAPARPARTARKPKPQ